MSSERRWPWRLLAAGYLPVGLVAVLLTASRGGFLAAVVALAGSGVLLAVLHPRKALAGCAFRRERCGRASIAGESSLLTCSSPIEPRSGWLEAGNA